MQFLQHHDLSTPEIEEDNRLPVEPPDAPNGLRNLWDQHDYLLSMMPRLADFGIPVLDALGLTINEAIIAEEDLPSFGLKTGDELIAKGTVVNPRMVSLLSAMGIDKVIARPMPRVVVIALSPVGAVSSFAIAAEAKLFGAQVHRVTAQAEDVDEIVHCVSEQLVRADLIVTVGGMGENGLDFRDSLDDIGPNDFTPVAVSPGKDQGFALAGDERVPLVALPWDPGAGFVLTKLLIGPMIRHLMGVQDDSMQLQSGVLSRAVRVTPGIVTCVPGVVDAGISITGSFAKLEGLYRLYTSNALVVIESEDGLADERTKTWYLPL